MKKTISIIFCLFFIFTALTPSSYSAQESLDISDPAKIEKDIYQFSGSDYNEEEGFKVQPESINQEANDTQVGKTEEIVVINDEIVSNNPSLQHLSKARKHKEEKKEVIEEVKTKKQEKEMTEIPKKLHNLYKSFISIGVVSSAISFMSKSWKKTKEFIKNLPGIRHYLNSKYSKENYKKELRGPAIEVNKPNLKKMDTEGMNMLQQGGVNETVLETSTGKKVKVQPL